MLHNNILLISRSTMGYKLQSMAFRRNKFRRDDLINKRKLSIPLQQENTPKPAQLTLLCWTANYSALLSNIYIYIYIYIS